MLPSSRNNTTQTAPNKPLPFMPNLSTKPFSCVALATIFANLEPTEADLGASHTYRVTKPRSVSQAGTEAGTISFSEDTMYVYVDNFPGPKRHHTSQIPILTFAHFLSEIKRMGLDVELVSAEKV
jgi:hypothetical protein